MIQVQRRLELLGYRNRGYASRELVRGALSLEANRATPDMLTKPMAASFRMRGAFSMLETGEQLWTFALSFYRRPGVKEALLCLQNEGGVDVPILLCSIFMAVRHQTELGRDQISEMDSLSEILRSTVIRPLRAMRTHLKSCNSLPFDATRLRSFILRTELGAEREQLSALANYLSSKKQAADPSSVTAAIQTVCRFYFDQRQLPKIAMDRLNQHIVTVDRATSSP